MILFTAVQCELSLFSLNLLTFVTAKAKSGLVLWTKFSNEPTLAADPSDLGLSLCDTSMPTYYRNSSAYLPWLILIIFFWYSIVFPTHVGALPKCLSMSTDDKVFDSWFVETVTVLFINVTNELRLNWFRIPFCEFYFRYLNRISKKFKSW